MKENMQIFSHLYLLSVVLDPFGSVFKEYRICETARLSQDAKH